MVSGGFRSVTTVGNGEELWVMVGTGGMVGNGGNGGKWWVMVVWEWWER